MFISHSLYFARCLSKCEDVGCTYVYIFEIIVNDFEIFNCFASVGQRILIFL